MPIQLNCPQCDAKMRAPEAVIGKQVKCPKCQSMFLALDGPPPALVAAPAAPPPAMVSAPAPDPYAADDEPAYRPGPRGAYAAGDVPGYRTLISPIIGVHVVFWGTAAVCLYYGLRLLVDAVSIMDRSIAAGFHEFIAALFVLLVIPFMVRLQCEMFVVLYQILQTLRENRDRQR